MPSGPREGRSNERNRERRLKTLTRSLVRHAHAIAREVGARVVLLYADVVEDDQDLADLIQDVDFRVILVSRRAGFQAPGGWGELCAIVRVPDITMTRAGQIKVATLVAAAEGLLRMGDRIVCLTGIDRSGTIDMIIVLDLGTEIEMFADTAADPLPSDVVPAVFERLLTLASELGLEGREGRTVGTLFVVGDSDSVLAQSHQLVINPFHGYPENERNVLDPRLEETIKEFSAIDGAFVIRGDGVVLNAGRYLAPRGKLEEPLPHGLGTRHEAAASITVSTDSVAFCVSQSTGTISIYKKGRLITDIQKPRGRASDL
jgi:diadenylate cyclase